MDIELKPCPFCGNTKLKIESKHHGHHYYEGTHSASVRCSKCHARGPTASCKVEKGKYHTDEETNAKAAALWNAIPRITVGEENNYSYLTTLPLTGLASWLDLYGQFEGSPWMTWFNTNYCNKCEPIECTYADYWKTEDQTGYAGKIECAYCELKKKCKFFLDLEEAPDNRDIIEMWLKEHIKDADL